MKEKLRWAYNANEEVVFLAEAKKGEAYICPLCGQVVKVRQGQYQKHFYHCFSKTLAQGGEKATHRQLKEKVQHFLQDCGQEVYAEYVFSKRRADLFIPPKQVIEIQCSRISWTELSQRHTSYQQLSIIDRWLLGPKYQSYRTCYPFFSYTPALGFYIEQVQQSGFFIYTWVPAYFRLRLRSMTSFVSKQTFWYAKPQPNLRKKTIYEQFFQQRRPEIQELIFQLYACGWHWRRLLPCLEIPVNYPFYSLKEEICWKVQLLFPEQTWPSFHDLIFVPPKVKKQEQNNYLQKVMQVLHKN